MNKQELIEYCESLKGSLNKFINGIDVNKIIKKIEQLNEPQKVTVPQFVADWIKKCKTFEHLISLSFALNPISWEENRLSDECMPAIYLKGIREGYAWTGDEVIIGNVYQNPELLEVTE